MEARLVNKEPVVLQPFLHQVGGHSSMLKFDEHTLCKPLFPREHHFYQHQVEEMSEFIPKYKGAIEVEIHEDSDGYLSLLGYPVLSKKKLMSGSEDSDETYSPGSSGEWSSLKEEKSDSDQEQISSPIKALRNHSPQADDIRFRLRQSGRVEVESEHRDLVKHININPEELKKVEGTKHNPYSLCVHKNTLTKMMKTPDKPCKFILLEDVASQFVYPCVLDLKMGTRVHGDYDSEQKQQRKMAKCAASTSSSLGIRLMGMQVYQAKSGRFICHNKYYGRGLTREMFKKALCQFLHNGYKMRINLVDTILERLKHFHAVISGQNTFRFYSSSLLIMYDGKERQTQLRTCRDDKQQECVQKSRSDEKDISLCIKENVQQTTKRQSRSLDRTTKSSRPTSKQNSPERSRSPSTSPVIPSRKVDVRMIDFAHVTHKGYHDDPPHNGPDKGYIFGLENLIKLFETIKEEFS